MLAPLEDKPDAQEIITDDAAAGGEYIAQGIMDAVKICLARKKMGDGSTEKLKTPDFHDGAQPSGDNKKQHLFLAQ